MYFPGLHPGVPGAQAVVGGHCLDSFLPLLFGLKPRKDEAVDQPGRSAVPSAWWEKQKEKKRGFSVDAASTIFKPSDEDWGIITNSE